MNASDCERSIQRLLGVVLCGGQSLRMGRDKAALVHADGVSFLQHAIDRLSNLCDRVVVSGRTSIDHSVEMIEDPVTNRGPATGIAAALQYADRHGFAACLVTPVDMPRLTVDHLSGLVDDWQSADEITVAESDRVQPLVGIYPVRFADPLQRLAQSEDRSLFRWLGLQDHHRVTLPTSDCHNVNTPEDLTDVR
ncbi:molybdenum cofactor guanylyltransferase [Novipirellula caenicola]|uniref:molybdenum cofactor guanylyltransferase n=1 Tax=Novipirellula caenicola TaxID=1536901 RepID=UPI0031E8E619